MSVENSKPLFSLWREKCYCQNVENKMSKQTRDTEERFYYQFGQLKKETKMLPEQINEKTPQAFLRTLGACVKRLQTLCKMLYVRRDWHTQKQLRLQLNEQIGHLLMRPQPEIPKHKRKLWQLGKDVEFNIQEEKEKEKSKIKKLPFICPYFEGLERARVFCKKVLQNIQRGHAELKQTQTIKTRLDKYTAHAQDACDKLSEMHATYIEMHSRYTRDVSDLYDIYKERELNSHRLPYAKKRQKKLKSV